MSFVRGRYDYRIDPACTARFERVLDEAVENGIPRQDFFGELWRVYGDVQSGRRPTDLDELQESGHYSVSIYGYRVHLRIDQHEMVFEIFDIEDPV